MTITITIPSDWNGLLFKDYIDFLKALMTVLEDPIESLKESIDFLKDPIDFIEDLVYSQALSLSTKGVYQI